jgi:hypothetical protein
VANHRLGHGAQRLFGDGNGAGNEEFVAHVRWFGCVGLDVWVWKKKGGIFIVLVLLLVFVLFRFFSLVLKNQNEADAHGGREVHRAERENENE